MCIRDRMSDMSSSQVFLLTRVGYMTTCEA
jgi:hypothetical protein